MASGITVKNWVHVYLIFFLLMQLNLVFYPCCKAVSTQCYPNTFICTWFKLTKIVRLFTIYQHNWLIHAKCIKSWKTRICYFSSKFDHYQWYCHPCGELSIASGMPLSLHPGVSSCPLSLLVCDPRANSPKLTIFLFICLFRMSFRTTLNFLFILHPQEECQVVIQDGGNNYEIYISFWHIEHALQLQCTIQLPSINSYNGQLRLHAYDDTLYI